MTQISLINHIRSVPKFAADFNALPLESRREVIRRIGDDFSAVNIAEVIKSEAEYIKLKEKEK